MPFVNAPYQYEKPDVLIIGAGVIGLTIGWYLRGKGLRVLLLDPAPATGATYAAAGMLAPVSEFHYREDALQRLMLQAAGLWPEFARAVTQTTGEDPGYLSEGTLLAGFDAADRRMLGDLMAAQQQHGLPAERLDPAGLAAAEPLLAAGGYGFRARSDHQVDPRRLTTALLGVLPVLPVRVIAAGRQEVLLEDNSRLCAGAVILANGLGAADLKSLGDTPLPRLRLRPVFGDILRLAAGATAVDQPRLKGTLRGLVRGRPVYLVPRSDGSVVLGATQREDGRAEPLAGGVLQLLRDAQALVPLVEELTILEVMARARPATPDNAPLIGWSEAGPLLATGLFRHGVLLAPVVAELCWRLLNGEAGAEDRVADFHPERFQTLSRQPAEPG